MSGLLDKANESAKSTENKPEGEVSDAVIDVFPEDSNGSGLNAQKLQFQLGSIAVLIVFGSLTSSTKTRFTIKYWSFNRI